jgi:hypothetical protein
VPDRFRWVALQLDAVAKSRSLKALRVTLSSLPPTLDETYSRILNAIEDVDQPRIYLIFQWLCFARRVILVGDLAVIWLVGDGQFSTPSDVEDIPFDAFDILSVCNGLISQGTIRAEDSPLWIHYGTNVKLNIVELCHLSVKEYLLSMRATSWCIHEERAHLSIVRSTIAYHSYATAVQSNSHLPIEETARKDSLAEYSAVYAMGHLDRIHPREHPSLLESFWHLFPYVKNTRVLVEI